LSGPESRRNALLRRIDWQFLLRQEDTPVALDLTSGADSEAIRIAMKTVGEPAPGAVSLVVLGSGRTSEIRHAADALSPGGEVAIRLRLPLPGLTGRTRRRLEAAGFGDIRFVWPGPLPTAAPQFWLPLFEPAAEAHLLASRPPRTPVQGFLRRIWRMAARRGVLAPVWALASAAREAEPNRATQASASEADGGLPLLLTGGKRSINKVVALNLGPDGKPTQVNKFARVAEADAGLDREAAVLEELERRRPEVAGVPRLRGRGRCVGRPSLTEDAVSGQVLLDALTPDSFAGHARLLTRWLGDLAGNPPPQPKGEWWDRLVGGPLREFEENFGFALGPAKLEVLRARLESLEDLPLVPEHRDCSPWNVLLTPEGEPALLDWESAEPSGLPLLDLVYFLANSAFVLSGALESGRTREAYRAMLDATSPEGEVAFACMGEYRDRLGIAEAAIAPLRLLCWLVHSRSEHFHLELDGRADDESSIREAVFLGLLDEELALDSSRSADLG